MRLLFDLHSTQPQPNAKFHGAGKYGLSLFQNLVRIAPEKIAVYYDDTAHIEKWVVDLIELKKLPKYIVGETSIYDAARQEGGLIFIPMIGAHEFPYPPCDISLIATIHDLRHFVIKRDNYYRLLDTRSFPNTRFALHLLKNAICRNGVMQKIFERIESFINRKNVYIVTVSNHSKYCILDKCQHVCKDKLGVFWSPSTVDKDVRSDDENKYGKYWLLVGINRYEKNGLRAIQAFDELFSQHPDVEGVVVATGFSSWSQIKVKIKNKHRFKLLGYVDEKTLKTLYHFAYSFMYPTLDEGFGYPPIEAMAEGCPVMASAVGSITEICGDSVLYFNPYSIDEMKNRILQMDDETIHNTFCSKVRNHYEFVRKKQQEDLEALCNYIMSFIK